MQHKNVKLFAITLFYIGLTGCQTNSLKDIDGNVYKTLTIGTQVWMAKNLKTTKFNDGTAIPLVTDNTAWEALTTPAYCWYNNNKTANKNKYGALYNWFAVNTNKLCPTGWHVPTNHDWGTLTVYLSKNGYDYGGSRSDIAKSMAATSGWLTDTTAGNVGNDQASNNSSGFTALPSGYRVKDGSFGSVGYSGNWWSMEEDAGFVWSCGMLYNYSVVHNFAYLDKQKGFSVRCLKDQDYLTSLLN